MCIVLGAAAPNNPANVHVVTTDRGKISLSWQPAVETANAPVEDYIIEVAKEGSNDFAEIAKVSKNTCHFDATGLEDGQKYNFRIKAQNQCGTSSGTALDKPIIASPLGD